MLDPATVSVIAVTFLAAGTVKGVVGLGLPTIALALLTLALDLTSAMALLLVPSFATNIWQATSGGHGRAIIARIWPFLVAAMAAISLGAVSLTRVDPAWLTALLGTVLIGYAAVSLAGVTLALSRRNEPWAGPLLGFANGVLTGMTGTFVVPGIMYLQALGLSRDALVQAMGILFTASTAGLAMALQGNGLLRAELGLASLAGLVPALLGMAAGRALRRRLPEPQFRRLLFVAILLLGVYIVARAAFAGV